MTIEGVAVMSRVALVAVLILVTAVVRKLVGSSKRLGLYMQFGTLGGMAVGVAAASLISRWMMTDVSVMLACLGIFVGWGGVWLFARPTPPEAN